MKIALMLFANALEMAREVMPGQYGQHRDAVFVSLCPTDDNLITAEIDVLDTQATAFEHAESGAVEQQRHQPRNTMKPLEYGADFFASQDDR